MKKAHRSVLGGMIVLVALAFAFAFSAYADVRTDTARDRGTTGRLPEPTPTPVPPPPPPTPTPPPPSGGITSNTNGDVSSGGNTGGTVVTGDQHVDVHEINIGPTNPPPPPPPPVVSPPPPPVPQCDPRDRTCATQDTGRTR